MGRGGATISVGASTGSDRGSTGANDDHRLPRGTTRRMNGYMDRVLQGVGRRRAQQPHQHLFLRRRHGSAMRCGHFFDRPSPRPRSTPASFFFSSAPTSSPVTISIPTRSGSSKASSQGAKLVPSWIHDCPTPLPHRRSSGFPRGPAASPPFSSRWLTSFFSSKTRSTADFVTRRGSTGATYMHESARREITEYFRTISFEALKSDLLCRVHSRARRKGESGVPASAQIVRDGATRSHAAGNAVRRTHLARCRQSGNLGGWASRALHCNS